jgi:hypothetical protein
VSDIVSFRVLSGYVGFYTALLVKGRRPSPQCDVKVVACHEMATVCVEMAVVCDEMAAVRD